MEGHKRLAHLVTKNAGPHCIYFTMFPKPPHSSTIHLHILLSFPQCLPNAKPRQLQRLAVRAQKVRLPYFPHPHSPHTDSDQPPNRLLRAYRSLLPMCDGGHDCEQAHFPTLHLSSLPFESPPKDIKTQLTPHHTSDRVALRTTDDHISLRMRPLQSDFGQAYSLYLTAACL